MKKRSTLLGIMMALLLTINLMGTAHASELAPEIEPRLSAYKLLKSASDNNCPYGRLTGAVYYAGEDAGHGQYIRIKATTSIQNTNNAAEVTTGIECQYSDTGLPGSYSWSTTNSEYNTKSCTGFADLYYVDYNRDISVFTSHQVTYTNSYVLYMSANLDLT